MIHIPLIYIKDKQAFRKEGNLLRFMGSPIDIAKKFKKKNYKLIHIVDLDALDGISTNLDIYDSLTFFINVQVECTPNDSLVKSLLNLKCRVVLPPSELNLANLKEKRLLVGKISKPQADIHSFYDLVLDEANNALVEKFAKTKKRLIVHSKDYEKLNSENQKQIWGVIEG